MIKIDYVFIIGNEFETKRTRNQIKRARIMNKITHIHRIRFQKKKRIKNDNDDDDKIQVLKLVLLVCVSHTFASILLDFVFFFS